MCASRYFAPPRSRTRTTTLCTCRRGSWRSVCVHRGAFVLVAERRRDHVPGKTALRCQRCEQATHRMRGYSRHFGRITDPMDHGIRADRLLRPDVAAHRGCPIDGDDRLRRGDRSCIPRRCQRAVRADFCMEGTARWTSAQTVYLLTPSLKCCTQDFGGGIRGNLACSSSRLKKWSDASLSFSLAPRENAPTYTALPIRRTSVTTGS